MINVIVKFFLNNKLVAWILLLMVIGWGVVTAPFDIVNADIPRDPVAVDAIPDIGENQQIVYTEWAGRSPQDVQDQITYPLTSSLLGIPGVKNIRSNSMFGFSSIYIIFEENVEFYWSRSRILEKLNSLPKGLLPNGVQPSLGPDATALGQVYWYTLEGVDTNGNTTGGWDLHELRSIQDFYVKYGLQSSEGVAEVASIGGFVQEYQIDLLPEKMRNYDITISDVVKSAGESNLDVGAQTLEINKVEYFVRGLGYVKSIGDIEQSVVKVRNNTPIRIKDIARVHLGPASRRGILDKSGAPAVGGVVVARYGANPLEVIENVKDKIAEIEGGLPKKELDDGTISQVQIVPFYDRSKLIYETLGTLNEALTLEILITIIVVILMLMHLRSSILISASLPVAVLMCFIAMRYFGVDANIVALSGIAIAVGTMVDMGIVLTERMVQEMKTAPPGQSLKETIFIATTDVASAVITAVATTIISFLPVFTMEAAEGKLFRPLAFTKTFALLASIILAITVIPPMAEQLFKLKKKGNWTNYFVNGVLIILSIYLLQTTYTSFGVVGIVIGFGGLASAYIENNWNQNKAKYFDWFKNGVYALFFVWFLASTWMPLGVEKSEWTNFLFVLIIIGCLIGFFYVVIHFYEQILRFLLQVKYLFIVLLLLIITIGFKVFQHTGQEFMPSLNEGSFLLMPSTMPHAGMEVNEEYLKMLDQSVTALPEVENVVGKAGRVESPLDPAPMSMFENIISYKSEYKTDENGHRERFKTNSNGLFILDVRVSKEQIEVKGNQLPSYRIIPHPEDGANLFYDVNEQKLVWEDDLPEGLEEIEQNIDQYLIPDSEGLYFRQWRSTIQSRDDIWNEIVKASKIPGLTSASKLQPIETRLVMLQTGMRAPMGIKIKGGDLKTIEAFGIELEEHLKEIKGVKASAVFADRIVGKPYLNIDIQRDQISRYGLTIQDVQMQIQTAIGGKTVSTTVEGRERYDINVRYPRGFRKDPESIKQILVATPTGKQIRLGELVKIEYEKGPQAIKSEDGFLTGYVLFDKEKGYAEVELVENIKDVFQEKIDNGEITVPEGVTYSFAGNYEQQVRANKRLSIVIPIALVIIFLILYFQFKSVTIALFVFSGVFVAFAGGFIMIGLYGQEWFMNFSFFGNNMRDIFQVETMQLSVAVWVGFLALFGIATDDGVLVATFLKNSFQSNQPKNINEIHDAVVEGGLQRVRPAMMTTATTILALLPILTSTGKGAGIMLPMAIPSFGGMVFNVITMFTVPVLFCIWKEWALKIKTYRSRA